jgi:methylase of polypeptide subunit release factors
MLRPVSPEGFHRLRQFLDETRYVEPDLRKALGAAELPSRQLRNRARLLDRTAEPTVLNILIRWFWIGIPQPQSVSSSLLPQEFMSLLVEAGLLETDGEDLKPAAMLLPIDEFIVASDHPSAIEQRLSDLVLWPNPTSKFLSRFAVRRRSRATLDLGTGSGILSLYASRFSDSVVATDLNERAVTFARFNAQLNGIENIEVISGDCFAPVEGRRFDLILSNPPFFITPSADYLFCDNSMELDGLCRRLAKEAPDHLNEGGFMEMLCEWAQIKGQTWEERVAEWLQETGCDAWVMKGITQDPEEYAQHRIRETSQDTSQDDAQYADYMRYYRHRGVEAIHDGLIVMRRRSGQNFVRIEEVPPTPTGDLSELILSTFAAHDLLREHDTDEKLLAIRPVLSPHVRLEQICKLEHESWKAESLTLRLKIGFPFHVDIQPLVTDFLALCDGNRLASEAIEAFAQQVNIELERVTPECLKMIRKLVERGLMVAAAPGNESAGPASVEAMLKTE